MQKILVVEDSLEVRENLVDLLEVNDYQVLCASDGESGLSIALAELPDLIISDIMMPKSNGHELLKNLRANDETSNIPLIFLTAKASMNDLRTGMNLGADDYITKPYESKELLSAIETRLARKKEVEQKLQYMSESISSYIPHELRTPLMAITGFSNIILNEIEFIRKEDVYEMTQRINNAAGRLNKIIEKFIAFAEAEYRKNYKAENLHFRDSVAEINPIHLAYIFNQKLVTYDFHIDFDMNVNTKIVKIKETDLVIILSELFDNAIKFSDRIWPIQISSHIENNKLLLSIKNSGKGLSAAEIKSVAPFNQHNRSLRNQSGNGLGLAIVKRLCEFYDIKFTILSEVNSFTEIILEFEIAQEQE